MVSEDLIKFVQQRDNARNWKSSYILTFKDLGWDTGLFYKYNTKLK